MGRVVIPKEIRRTMHLKEGEPLEIFTEGGGGVVFKRYSPVGELAPFADQYAESIYQTTGIPTVICDKTSVVAAFGVSKRELIEKPLSDDVLGIIAARSTYTGGCDGSNNSVELIRGSGRLVSCLCPILAEGSSIGAVITLKDENGRCGNDVEVNVLKTASSFLSKRIEY